MFSLNETQAGVLIIVLIVCSIYGTVILLEDKECIEITVISKSRSYYTTSIETEIGTLYPNTDEMYNKFVIGKTYNITYVRNIWDQPPITEMRLVEE